MNRAPAALLLGLVFAVNLLAMPRSLYRGDSIPVLEEARAVALGDGLSVSAEIAQKTGEPGQWFVLNEKSGKYRSKYGVMNTVMWVPAMLAERVLTGELPSFQSATRVLVLNLTMIAVSLWLGWLLYRLAGLYVARSATRLVFVLCAFYSTFLWNYLRAQTSEAFQVLFFTGFLLHLLRHLREGRPRDFALSSIYLAALCLTKLSYLAYLPMIPVAIWVFMRDARRALRMSAAPIAGIVAVVAAVNWIKFGAPWLTGYHQWVKGMDYNRPVGDLAEGLSGFLFNPQWSIFTHFPLLALSVFGVIRFYKENKREALLLYCGFLPYFLLVAKMPGWSGEWCYGPRYLLFFLPALSLPALRPLDSILSEWKKPRIAAAAALVAAVFAYSAFLQHQVNRLGFFTYYLVREPVKQLTIPALTEYFSTVHFGRFNWELSRHHEDPSALGFVRELRKSVPAERLAPYQAEIGRIASQTNFYWF